MATIDVKYEHSLPIAEAAQKLRIIIDDFQEKNSDFVQSVSWETDGLSALATGNGFVARFRVDERQAQIEVDLNLMLRPFKKKITERLERKLEEVLS